MNKQYGNLPDIVEKDESEIKYIISLLKDSNLPDDVKTFVIKCVELALWFPLFLQKKNISYVKIGFFKTRKKIKTSQIIQVDIS